MQPSMGILTLPCPRVVKHSASTRRLIFTYKKSRLDESLPYLFLAAVNLHRTSLWGMVNLYLIMLIVLLAYKAMCESSPKNIIEAR